MQLKKSLNNYLDCLFFMIYINGFFRVKRTKGNFFDIISNWKWLSVEIGYMALLVAFDIPSEFDVLLAACG